MREVLGIVADYCLLKKELETVRTPYSYGIDFIESPRDIQIKLEETMKSISPVELLQPFNKIRMKLEEDFDTWEKEMDGDAGEYINILKSAEDFLMSDDTKVYWVVTYDE